MWFQIIAWASARSSELKAVTVFRSSMYLAQYASDSSTSAGLRPIPDDCPEPVPVGVDRQRLGRPGETVDQAFRSGKSRLCASLITDPIRARVSRSASLGSMR